MTNSKITDFTRYSLIHIFLPLFLGGGLYLFYAAKPLPFFLFLENVDGLISYKNWVQESFPVPNFFIYQVPDALWAYALCASLLWIWRYQHAAIPVLLALFVCNSYEFGQAWGYVDGVFDWWDVWAMSLACLVVFFFTKN